MAEQNYEVRPIDGSLDQYVSLAGEALLSHEQHAWEMYVDRVGRENLRGVYRDDRLAGGMAFYRMGQYFGGNALDCAGFSGVAISPTERGNGAGGKLLKSVLGEIRDEGIPIASLYASTQSLYRGLGFEQAGTQTLYSIPLNSIACHDRELEIHRLTDPPLEKLNRIASVRAERGNGQLRRTTGLWKRLIDPYDQRGSITYLIGDFDAPEGYAIFRPGTREGGVPQPLISTDVVANTPAALRRLLTLIRDHRSMCDSFEWYGAPNDSLHYFADEQWLTVKHFVRWMLRIVDLPAALTGRGYAPSLEGELHFKIEDTVLPENSGSWKLVLNDGKASVEPGGRGDLAMDIQTLAPMFSSLYSATELAQLGKLRSNSPSQIDFATDVFAGPAPWVPELY
ncbi:MAG: GNAT family N-acetyltransferase [Rubripirellula sp.]